MLHEGYLANQFLVSMPQLEDDDFHQTVTLICQHNEQGALGIIVNRLGSHTLGDVFDQLEIIVSDLHCTTKPVLEGGPVHQEYGLVLHSRETPQIWDSSIQISAQLGITSSRDILQDIAAGNGPQNFIMSLGYAGWGPGQLEQEIRQNAWLSTPVDDAIIFDTDMDNKWQRATDLLGIDHARLSSQFGHA